MPKLRLICIWRAEEAPDDSGGEFDDRQADEHDLECDERPIVRHIPELTCIHKLDREACPICSRDWTQPQTGQLPYRPKAA